MTVKATFVAAFPEARRISNYLERDYGDAGVAVSLDERLDGLWSAEAYFAAGTAEEIAGALRDWLGSDGWGAPLSVETLAESDWVSASLATLKPVAAGRFVVHGSHDRDAVPPGRIAIEIDAGQAFGTGHHGTTAGCLSVLDNLVRARRFRAMLDLGAGSGVLAIALAKVLRRPVIASDIDPVATAVAGENTRRNHVGHLVTTVTANGVSHPAIRQAAPFDLIVANILAEPLCRLAPPLAQTLAPDGVLVLSGLLPGQRGRVAAAYRRQGLSLVKALHFDGWAVLVLQCPNRW